MINCSGDRSSVFQWPPLFCRQFVDDKDDYLSAARFVNAMLEMIGKLAFNTIVISWEMVQLFCVTPF
jgi:hypothetical protein